MNKNFKIIQINGLSGLLLLGMITTGVICGFVLFPVWVMMIGWNSIVNDILKGPSINYFQAFLLWLVVALLFYLILKNSVSIKVQGPENMSETDIKEIVNEIRQEKEDTEKSREEV